MEMLKEDSTVVVEEPSSPVMERMAAIKASNSPEDGGGRGRVRESVYGSLEDDGHNMESWSSLTRWRKQSRRSPT